MRRLILSSLMALSFAISAPAFAKGNGFETSITAPLNTPLKVEVVIGEDLAYRANNLPKKISDRNSSRLNSGFGNNGFYGERDLNRLAERLQKRVEKRLNKRGVLVADSSATTLRIVIKDAKPNRPTFKQLSKEPSLSYQSFGLGGAEIEAQIIQAGGVSAGDMSYRFFETTLDRFDQANSTWSDAYRAFDRFARNAAKTLQTKS